MVYVSKEQIKTLEAIWFHRQALALTDIMAGKEKICKTLEMWLLEADRQQISFKLQNTVLALAERRKSFYQWRSQNVHTEVMV